MLKDLIHNLLPKQSLAPVALSATTSGEIIDTQGASVCMVLVSVGVVSAADASNYCTVTMLAGDESDMSDYDDFTIATADYIEPMDSDDETWDRVINATTEGSKDYAFGFIPPARYIRPVFTETSTFSAIMGCTVILGWLRNSRNDS